ncbi:hypothetical protein M427DRAFT_31145 [Gonapodya prolifera JEL478]|uniref:Uncharacterized protein n=1 Tax=Gonapodya prolifera (strain JEL478) TaxID=1344416 RepID=A0A139AI22_GONPJ|nr:hypothetical protein M427DRAFT_31145 [Gonapodya prolifera JEL478]|eukprot:KXS16410.1 hypothetical protein M427DRAFT_31145 [Gonapodya prolifera JEL478]
MPSDHLLDVPEPALSRIKANVPRQTRAGSASVAARNQRSLDQMYSGPGRGKSQTLISSVAGFARSMVQVQGEDEERPPTKASAGDISKLEKILGVPRKVIARSASGLVDKSNTAPNPNPGSVRSRRAPAPQQMREGIQRFFSDVTLEAAAQSQAGAKQLFSSSSGEHLRAIVESHLRNSNSSDHAGAGLGLIAIDRSISEKVQRDTRTPNSRDPQPPTLQLRSASFSDAVRSPIPPQTLPTGPPAPKLKIKVPSHHLSQLMEFPGDKPAPAPIPAPAPEVPNLVVVKRFVLGASAGAYSRSPSQSEAGHGHGRGASLSSVAGPSRPGTATSASASPKSLNESMYGTPPTTPAPMSAGQDGHFVTPLAPRPKSP